MSQPKRLEFSDKTKQEALHRSGNSCQRCREPLTMDNAEFHHIKEAARGGDNTIANCEVLCNNCHVGSEKTFIRNHPNVTPRFLVLPLSAKKKAIIKKRLK